MARWIHVKQPFDYKWPDASAITHFHDQALGDQFVKDEVADFAVEKGYATEGKGNADSRSRKGTGARRRKKEAAAAADAGTEPPVGDESAADADRPADGAALDSDAG